jgi:hypothetical protein
MSTNVAQLRFDVTRQQIRFLSYRLLEFLALSHQLAAIVDKGLEPHMPKRLLIRKDDMKSYRTISLFHHVSTTAGFGIPSCQEAIEPPPFILPNPMPDLLDNALLSIGPHPHVPEAIPSFDFAVISPTHVAVRDQCIDQAARGVAQPRIDISRDHGKQNRDTMAIQTHRHFAQ